MVYTYKGHSTYVSEVAWSPNGKYIASAADDKTIQVWNAMTGRLLLTNKGYPDPMGSPIWSPDSKSIASSDTKAIRVWDAMTGKLLLTYRGHSEAAAPLTWSPDGKYILSGSWDITNQVWDTMTGKCVHTSEEASFVAAWPPDGKYVAFGSLGKRGQLPNNSDNDAHVVDATTWSTVLNYTGHARNYEKGGVWYPQGVSAIAWSPDGKYIASGGSDGTVQVWMAP